MNQLNQKLNKVLLVSIILWTACGTTQNGISDDMKEVAPRDPAKERSETVEDEMQAIKYRLIVSFISIGEGPDFNAKQSLDKIISDWENRIGGKIEAEQYPWGREGELDICYQLKDLNVDQQIAFITQIKDVVGASKLVQISENQPCLHKR